MKKRMLLLALAVTACGREPLHRELRDIPGLRLFVPQASEEESAVLHFDWSMGGDCYRVPSDTRVTINGEATRVWSRGDTHLSFDGAFSCEYPSFDGPPRPADEPRTEFLVTEGRTRMRAVFQALRAPRRIRVNGQEQATLRGGAMVDIEWLPATDQLEKVEVKVMGGTDSRQVDAFQVDGNHIRMTLPTLKAGSYVLRVYGQGGAGVEACEGFNSCHAEFYKWIEVPIVIE
ncbi:hypothetical protein JQX13_14835 [Archangium violaceum]|uniref:hypothetical protein n=1 Tax=Archangium violaceum TaxID=83451 RepID=UPI00193B0373|nr:hypothetical protein [Archangium violaceum]QRK11231.1 hypothetical protein JQX13_14835 [Archangium violaceum]